MATGYGYFTQASGGPTGCTNAAGQIIGILDYVLDVANTNGRKVATKVYSGTNLASYRFDASGTIRHYLDVNDSATLVASVRAYESMTAVGTGTDPYPLASQMATFQWNKSQTATARNWSAVVTDRFVLLIVEWNGTGFPGLYFFGELPSFDPLDTYCSVILGCGDVGVSTTAGSSGSVPSFMGNSVFMATVGQGSVGGVSNFTAGAFARSWDGTVKSHRAVKLMTVTPWIAWGTTSKTQGPHASIAMNSTSFSGYPIFPVFIRDHALQTGTTNASFTSTIQTIRCRIPFVFGVPFIANGLAPLHGDTFSIGGASYRLIQCQGDHANGFFALMTSNSEAGLP